MHKKKQIHGSGMDFKESFKLFETIEVSKGAKIRNRYNQVPHQTQDPNGKVTINE